MTAGRGGRSTWSDKKIEAELRAVVADLGHWPRKQELIDRKRTDLLGAIRRQGGLRYWADRLGYAAGHGGGQPYWTDQRIRETLRSFLKDRAATFPTRPEFEDAGLSGLWDTLARRRQLGRWAREFRLEEPRRGRPPKAR